jgi:hypothetical protein
MAFGDQERRGPFAPLLIVGHARYLRLASAIPDSSPVGVCSRQLVANNCAGSAFEAFIGVLDIVARSRRSRTRMETEMRFDEEKRGWAFAAAEGLEKRIAACEKLAETEAQREELACIEGDWRRSAGNRASSGGDAAQPTRGAVQRQSPSRSSWIFLGSLG